MSKDEQRLLRIFASTIAAALPLVGAACGTTTMTSSSCDGFDADVHDVPLASDGGLLAEGGLDCAAYCGEWQQTCRLSADGGTVSCYTPCTGRRPAGLVDDGNRAPRGLGEHFAAAARLEAASVDAFRRLAAELARFGAPSRLVRAARRAKDEERRHTRVMTALARRYGGRVALPRVAPETRRTLLDVAVENAVEGCVHETFGALVARWQAAHAVDADVRTAMARVAVDETRHAALAWQTHAWARTRLTRAEWARVEAAMERSTRELRVGCGASTPAIAVGLGMPLAGIEPRLVDELAARLWS